MASYTAKCIDCGTAIRHDVKFRCKACFLALKVRTPWDRKPGPIAPEDIQASLAQQDEKFRIAMIRAVNAGLERPPGMKVNTKPCTAYPVYVDIPRAVRLQSPSAWLAEMGDSQWTG